MSDISDLKDRLARLSPAQRALLGERLAVGPDAAIAGYQPIEPAIPLRTETTSVSGKSARRIADYPAAQSQSRMWFLHEFAEAVPVYVIPSAYHLAGPLDLNVLAQAVADVVGRHDTLRTTFRVDGAELFQISRRLLRNWPGFTPSRGRFRPTPQSLISRLRWKNRLPGGSPPRNTAPICLMPSGWSACSGIGA
jgi:hypothetical protein